jgi:hypothetical protein
MMQRCKSRRAQLQAAPPYRAAGANYIPVTGADESTAYRRLNMSKFVIAAVAATLLGSTAAALAEEAGGAPYESQLAFFANQKQYANPQLANARNAQARQTARDDARHVRAVTADENAYFDRATPETAN